MKYVVANWKQNKSIKEAFYWLEAYKESNPSLPSEVSVVIAPPFTLLAQMRWFVQTKDIPVLLAAQDISAHEDGAFTGEVGVAQLSDYIDAVIIGHSERRMYFGENNTSVAQKVAQTIENDLHAFVCIADQVTADGQVPSEKIDVEKSWYQEQITSVFSQISESNYHNVTLVYEPISAISTFGGVPLTADQTVTAIKDIQSLVSEDVAVMYGGSVTADNIATYWPLDGVSGVMPGGASLKTNDFLAIIQGTN